MPRPNALLESLDRLNGVPWERMRFTQPAPNIDPLRACPHKPWQTYTREPCSCGRELWPPRGRGRGESLTSPRRMEAKRRALEAYELHLQGWTSKQIAAKLGYRTPQGAWRACQRVREVASAKRNYDEWARSLGGKPKQQRPGPAETRRLLAQIDAYEAERRAQRERDSDMNEQRLEIAREQYERILSGKNP